MESPTRGESDPYGIASGESLRNPDSQRGSMVHSSTSIGVKDGDKTSWRGNSWEPEGNAYRRPGIGSQVGFGSVGGIGEDAKRIHVWASAKRRNGVVQTSDVGNVQDVTEPGATAIEVNTIYRMKLVAMRLRTLCGQPQVQRGLNLIFAVVLSWVVGKVALSLGPGIRNEVGGFLRTVSLGEYTELFVEKGYVSLQDMLLTTEEDLRDYVGIDVVPHRRRILDLAATLKTQQPVLPALLWLCIATLVFAAALLGVSMVVSAPIRDRVICVVMFWAFMSWHRVRLWRRLWSTLDVFSSPRVRPKECQPPTLLEPRRTFTAMNSPSSLSGPGPGLAEWSTTTDPGPGSRNSNNRLLNRLKKRRNQV